MSWMHSCLPTGPRIKPLSQIQENTEIRFQAKHWWVLRFMDLCPTIPALLGLLWTCWLLQALRSTKLGKRRRRRKTCCGKNCGIDDEALFFMAGYGRWVKSCCPPFHHGFHRCFITVLGPGASCRRRNGSMDFPAETWESDDVNSSLGSVRLHVAPCGSMWLHVAPNSDVKKHII